MKLSQLQATLSANPSKALVIELPSGEIVPRHFHITEVGKVTKDFVDCGGTRRSTTACVLQTWVASDVDHRLTTQKLEIILSHGKDLGLDGELPVEVETQISTIGLYELDEHRVSNEELTLTLKAKQTACLAPERCGLEVLPSGDCEGPSCC